VILSHNSTSNVCDNDDDVTGHVMEQDVTPNSSTELSTTSSDLVTETVDNEEKGAADVTSVLQTFSFASTTSDSAVQFQ